MEHRDDMTGDSTLPIDDAFAGLLGRALERLAVRDAIGAAEALSQLAPLLESPGARVHDPASLQTLLASVVDEATRTSRHIQNELQRVGTASHARRAYTP